MVYIIDTLCVLVFITSFFYDTSVLGYSESTGMINRVTYMFAHASLVHFIINMVSFNMLARAIKGGRGVVIGVVSAAAATFGSEMSIPTVGLSGVIYAMLGYIFALNPRCKSYNMALLLAVAVNIALSFIVSSSNCTVHLLSLAYGVALTFIINKLYNYGKKCKFQQSADSKP